MSTIRNVVIPGGENILDTWRQRGLLDSFETEVGCLHVIHATNLMKGEVGHLGLHGDQLFAVGGKTTGPITKGLQQELASRGEAGGYIAHQMSRIGLLWDAPGNLDVRCEDDVVQGDDWPNARRALCDRLLQEVDLERHIMPRVRDAMISEGIINPIQLDIDRGELGNDEESFGAVAKWGGCTKETLLSTMGYRKSTTWVARDGHFGRREITVYVKPAYAVSPDLIQLALQCGIAATPVDPRSFHNSRNFPRSGWAKLHADGVEVDVANCTIFMDGLRFVNQDGDTLATVADAISPSVLKWATTGHTQMDYGLLSQVAEQVGSMPPNRRLVLLPVSRKDAPKFVHASLGFIDHIVEVGDSPEYPLPLDRYCTEDEGIRVAELLDDHVDLYAGTMLAPRLRCEADEVAAEVRQGSEALAKELVALSARVESVGLNPAVSLRIQKLAANLRQELSMLTGDQMLDHMQPLSVSTAIDHILQEAL